MSSVVMRHTTPKMVGLDLPHSIANAINNNYHFRQVNNCKEK